MSKKPTDTKKRQIESGNPTEADVETRSGSADSSAKKSPDEAPVERTGEPEPEVAAGKEGLEDEDQAEEEEDDDDDDEDEEDDEDEDDEDEDDEDEPEDDASKSPT